MRSQSAQTTAESMRVVEMPCVFKNYAKTPMFSYIEDCLLLMRENYGLAGPAFMRDCFNDPEVFERIGAEARAWDAKHRKSNEERFWCYGLGTILAVGRLAVKLGYLNYDMDALERWVVKRLLLDIRQKVNDSLMSAVSMLGDYYANNINKVLVVESAARKSKHRPMGLNMDSYVKRYPQNTLSMRLEIDTQTLYISLKHLTEWCVSHRISWGEMKQQLVVENVWDGRTKLMNLAKDVDLLGRISLSCLKLDLSNCEYFNDFISEETSAY
jgi:hypothetical protein